MVRGSGGVVGQPEREGGEGTSGHLQMPTGMVVRGERSEFICQPVLLKSKRSIFSSSKELWHT